MKGIVLAAGIGVGVISLGAAATIGSQTDYLKAKADAYTLVLNKDNKPAELTSSYQDNFSGTVQTALGNDVTLNLVKAKTASNGFAELASRGQIYNFGATSGAVTGLTSVKITLSSGSATIRTAASSEISSNGVTLGKTISLTSGSSVTVPASNYFMVEAGDTCAVVSSLELSYNCATTDDVKRLNGTYTGNMTSDGYNYKLTLNDGSATLASINKDSNTSVNGTATLSGSTLTATFSGTTYTLTVSADAYSLTSSQITFYRVYDVEDFESYTTDGQGWASNRGESSQYDGTGVKGNYYCDYYGSNTIASPIGGSGWSMMGSTNYIIFNSSNGFNNSKTAAFKGNNGKLRFIQQKAYYGVPEVIGKGSTFSFRARGAVNSSFGDKAIDAKIKVFAYYNSKVTSSNQGTRTEKEFTIAAGSPWEEYTMPLDSSKNYYAFAFYTNNSNSDDRYIPIDDIKIYTIRPYTPVSVTGVTLNNSEYRMSVGETHQLTATIAPANADNHTVSWSSSNTSVATVDANGLVTAVGTGSATITVTTADGNKTATCALTVTQMYPSGTYSFNLNIKADRYDSDYTGRAYTIISISSNGHVEISVDGGTDHVIRTTSTVQSYTNNKFTIPISGSIGGDSVGNFTGTYDATNKQLKNCGFSGRFGTNSVKNNNSITFSHANFWDCNGTTTELRTTFSRYYGEEGSWTEDTGNADRITSVSSESIGEQKALRLRGYNGGKVALKLAQNISSTASNFSMWVYNPANNGKKVKVNMYASDGTKIFVFEKQMEQGWNFFFSGYDRGGKTIANFEIIDTSYSGNALIFDNIALL